MRITWDNSRAIDDASEAVRAAGTRTQRFWDAICVVAAISACLPWIVQAIYFGVFRSNLTPPVFLDRFSTLGFAIFLLWAAAIEPEQSAARARRPLGDFSWAGNWPSVLWLSIATANVLAALLPRSSPWYRPVTAIAGLAMLGFMLPLVVRRWTRGRRKGMKFLEWDEAGFRYPGGEGELGSTWTGCRGFVGSGSIALIDSGNHVVVAVPRSALSAIQQFELESAVRRHCA